MHFTKLLTVFLIYTFSNTLLAQHAVYKKVTEHSGIDKKTGPALFFGSYAGRLPGTRNNLQEMRINAQVLSQTLANKPETLSLSLPAADGSLVTADLLLQEIYSPGFRIYTSAKAITETGNRVYYRGIIRGVENSLVNLSFTERDVSGFISDESGSYQFLKTENTEIYSLKKAELSSKGLSCGTPDSPPSTLHQKTPALRSSTEVMACRPLSVFFDADYTLYQRLGSVTATINYVNLLFSRVATVFENEGIEIRLAGMKVWDSPSPYNDIKIGQRNDILMAYFNDETRRQNNADLTHLLYGAEFGGVAFVDVLGSVYNAALSGVSGNMQNLDQSILVVAHELGHNLGSPHTQSCFWPGGPIDGCVAPEGDCPPSAPVPEDGGTIMSYCPVVNLAKGFGPLPGALIRRRTAEFAGSKVVPTQPELLETSRSHALLTWQHPFIYSNFTINYREQGTVEWKTLNTRYNQLEIQDLKPSTTYDWRVKDACSDYAVSSFKTSEQPPVCRPSVQITNCEMRLTGIRSLSIDGRQILTESQCTPTGYSFHLRKETLFRPGKEYTFQLDYSASHFYSSIWMDLNGNGQWEETERLYISELQETLVNTGKIRIPENITGGRSIRMRILVTPSGPPVNACMSSIWGEAQDYLVTLTDCKNEIHPPQNLRITGVSASTADLLWEFDKTGPFKIDYRKNRSSDWTVMYDSARYTTLKNLTPLTTYEVRVSTACSEYALTEFTTALSEYCPVSHSLKNSCQEAGILGIQRVSVPQAGLDKSKDCSDKAYQLFDQTEVHFQAGRSYEFTVTPYASSYHVQLGIWMDLNGNGVFETNERLFFGFKKFNELHINGIIDLPEEMTPLKKTRMRLIVNNGHSQSPCGEQTFGETLDFDVSIQAFCPKVELEQPLIRQPTACSEALMSFMTNIKNGESVKINYILNNEQKSIDIPVHHDRLELPGIPSGNYHFTSALYNNCTMPLNATARVNAVNPVKANAGNTGPYYQGETIRLTAEGGSLYQWRGPENFSSPLQNPEIHAASLKHSGLYTVTVTDKDNCRDQATTEVEVRAVLANEAEHQLSVYPNPASEILTIRTSLRGLCEATLWSGSGNEIKKTVFTAATTLKIKKIPPGIYTLKVKNREAEINTRVVIL